MRKMPFRESSPEKIKRTKQHRMKTSPRRLILIVLGVVLIYGFAIWIFDLIFMLQIWHRTSGRLLN